MQLIENSADTFNKPEKGLYIKQKYKLGLSKRYVSLCSTHIKS